MQTRTRRLWSCVAVLIVTVFVLMHKQINPAVFSPPDTAVYNKKPLHQRMRQKLWKSPELCGSGLFHTQPGSFPGFFEFFIFSLDLLEQVDDLYFLRTVGLAVAALQAIFASIAKLFILL